ncbi:hypothetical protein [Cupriavidus basilensis]|uniref:hypothetical protein n=1 Tax=Cupriavidus basilensis TaxID=68895 RepID=UPI00320490CC
MQARQEAGQRQIEALERQLGELHTQFSMELERTREQVAVAQVQYTAVAGAEARARLQAERAQAEATATRRLISPGRRRRKPSSSPEQRKGRVHQ